MSELKRETIKIKAISEKEIQTKFGPKPKINIKSEHGVWYSCWKNPISSAWKVDQEISVDVQSRDYNGSTYYDIVLPKAEGQGFKAQALNTDVLNEILGELRKIAALLNKGNEYDIPV